VGRRKKLPLFEEVSIENIGAEGKSIARVDGIVVFVKDAVPGDVRGSEIHALQQLARNQRFIC